ncbi:MAG: hypothetical protein B7Y39_08325 [Bdellovibrio sp. 28-41-41]|nr:MAG: hypothetical protein B7Y39_08325 [Bdellovibrio sp. 28-41-41]
METKNYFTKSNWRAKTVQFAGLIAISFAVLISCQKKSDTGTVYATPAPIGQTGIIGTCTGCNFAQTQMAQPISRASSLAIQWNMMGDQAVIQQLAYTYGGYATIKNYVGPVVFNGSMTVSSAIQLGYSGYNGYGCQLPAGQYQITNYNQPGQMTSGGFLSNMQLVASGNGVQVLFTLTDASIGDLQGSGQITHINGLLVATTAVINGQQVSCNDNQGLYVTY